MLRNAQYWDKSVQSIAERVEVYWAPNEGTLVSEFKAKSLDWIELSARHTPTVPEGAEESAFRTLNIALIAFNVNAKKVKDIPLRRYMENLIDRDALTKEFPKSVPVRGPFPPMALEKYGLNLEVSQINPPKKPSKKLGSIDLLIMPVEPYKSIGEIVTQQWQSKGLRVRPILGQADFLKRLTEGNFDMALAYYGPIALSVEQYLWPYLSSMRPLPNAAGYISPALEKMYNAMTGQAELKEQAKSISSIIKLLEEDMPYISLFQLSFRIWHSKDLAPAVLANGIISLISHSKQ